MDLKAYQEDLITNNTQYIVINNSLQVLQSDHNLIAFKPKELISNSYPFFLSLEDLISKKENNTFTFSCIHFETKEGTFICDVTLKTFTNKDALIIIQDFTSHYNNYQQTSQERNESVIAKEKLTLQNLFLKKQEAFKSQFIANFSHELREPLLGVIAFAEILNKTDLDYQQKSYLDVISNSGLHLKKLIEDILLISTLRAKKIQLEKEAFDISHLINDLSVIYTEQASQKNISFKTNITGNAPKVIISDTIRLRQILSNILKNAINYTNEGDVIFSVSYNQQRAGKLNITFTVKDTGIGISEKDLPNLYTSFSQVKKVNQTDYSTNYGLGLAITKELLDAFEGDIDAKSDLGKGTTFTVNLNLKLDLSNKGLPIKKDIQLNDTPKKVILLDDSEVVQLSLFKMMYTFKNYALDIITNPEEFIPQLEINAYDLILLDMDLKTHNGLDLYEKLRKSRDKDLKKTPVIAVTANVLPKDLKRYKTAKIKTVLKKPFTEQELIEALNNEA